MSNRSSRLSDIRLIDRRDWLSNRVRLIDRRDWLRNRLRYRAIYKWRYKLFTTWSITDDVEIFYKMDDSTDAIFNLAEVSICSKLISFVLAL